MPSGQDPNIECAAARYLAREPEGLVVGGYRGLLGFAAERDVSRLEAVWNDFNRKLDRNCARLAMSGLESLIVKIGRCATCPLRFHCQGIQHLCRDECLILGLIASLQNGEDDAAFLSASALTSRSGAFEVLAAASEFAMALKMGGKQLLPIHTDTVRWIIGNRPHRETTTLH